MERIWNIFRRCDLNFRSFSQPNREELTELFLATKIIFGKKEHLPSNWESRE
jgi:hypothetical protein